MINSTSRFTRWTFFLSITSFREVRDSTERDSPKHWGVRAVREKKVKECHIASEDIFHRSLEGSVGKTHRGWKCSEKGWIDYQTNWKGDYSISILTWLSLQSFLDLCGKMLASERAMRFQLRAEGKTPSALLMILVLNEIISSELAYGSLRTESCVWQECHSAVKLNVCTQTLNSIKFSAASLSPYRMSIFPKRKNGIYD